MEKNPKLFSFSKDDARSVVGNPIVDRCRYQSRRPCFHNGHCSIFRCETCCVEVCFLHLNPSGWFQRRKFREVVF
jgi:hypothetical protein